MYVDEISIIEDGVETFIETYEDNEVFKSIDLTNTVAIASEISTGLFSANTKVNLINTSTLEIITYEIDSVIKNLLSADSVVAVNIGTQIEFIKTNGWLVKRYIATQELSDIVISSGIAGIIYKDKIEIIKL